MTKQEALTRLRRWCNSGMVTHMDFSIAFKHLTMKAPSRDLFVEVVEALGGWTIETSEFHFHGRIHYETKANIPDFVEEYVEKYQDKWAWASGYLAFARENSTPGARK